MCDPFRLYFSKVRNAFISRKQTRSSRQEFSLFCRDSKTKGHSVYGTVLSDSDDDAHHPSLLLSTLSPSRPESAFEVTVGVASWLYHGYYSFIECGCLYRAVVVSGIHRFGAMDAASAATGSITKDATTDSTHSRTAMPFSSDLKATSQS